MASDEVRVGKGTATLFERQQHILDILRQQSGVKVSELAERLGVSKVTIRNDLNALEEMGQINRVRGGAVPKNDYIIQSPAIAARSQVNKIAKQRIARRAADMVEPGDSILLDGSTTVFYMVPFLRTLHNLTIVTNSIEVGLALAKDSSHTVILLGGVLHPEEATVIGHLGEHNLAELHIKTAFLSCTGFSLEAGLTQLDMLEAQLKRRMIQSSEQVVALIDSSKLGRTDLTSFADVSQIAYILTDNAVKSEFVEQMRQTNTVLIVCGEKTVSSYAPVGQQQTHYKIGFANLSEVQSPFAVDVRHGLEQAAQKIGNIDLIMADNRFDGDVALIMADHLVAKEVDLVIEYQIDEKTGGLVASKFHAAGIPVIAIDIPMVGATYFGVDNYRAGHIAGLALGDWLKTNWQGCFDQVLVLEAPQAGPLPAARIRGQLDGLREISGAIPEAKLIYLNSGNRSDTNEKMVLETLETLPVASKVVIISINDSAAIGALQAACQAGREADVVIVSQGADKRVRAEIRRPGSPIMGATAYWPERYGQKLLDIALKILQGEPVPPAVYMDHVFIDAHNLNEFYPDDVAK